MKLTIENLENMSPVLKSKLINLWCVKYGKNPAQFKFEDVLRQEEEEFVGFCEIIEEFTGGYLS